MNKFSKILIANRGEIALRIIRAAREMNIRTVAVYSEGEEKSLHVIRADERVCLGSGDLSSTYLNVDKMVAAALKTGAVAIHPGYGFLSENPTLADECRKNNLIFIGPGVDVLEKMGNKITAKEIAREAGVNVLSTTKIDADEIETLSDKLTFPLLIKASHGGGGKGMRVLHSAEELLEKAKSAMRSAERYFGNGEIYLETYIPDARHIEVQIMGDNHGNLVHLFERDCTLQRNHQKIIEEAPALSLSENLRRRLHEAALSIGRAVGYVNAGTVEFFIDRQDQFYFLEVNPRIQVEHPVTEQITGVDIVKEQLSIAAGNPLSFSQADINIRGHAIEARIYAENPFDNFAPSTLPVRAFRFPDRAGVRVETDCQDEAATTVSFDPLLAKIIVTGTDREDARLELIKALSDTAILGPVTNQPYLLALLRSEPYRQIIHSTQYCWQAHTEIEVTMKEAKQLADYRPVISAALFLFFGKKTSGGSIWQNIGFWRISQMIELQLDNVLKKVRFRSDGNLLNIEMPDNIFSASVEVLSEKMLDVTIDHISYKVTWTALSGASVLIGNGGFVFEVASPDRLDYYPDKNFNNEFDSQDADNLIRSHLYGKIIAVHAEKDQTVDKGDLLLVIESMKSENHILSHRKGRIKAIVVSAGDQVSDQSPLVYLEEL